MRDENKIKQRLKQDYDKLTNSGLCVVGVFLQGSQNYNLDYSESDIDTKAIVIPSFEDMVLGKSMISRTDILPSEEHLDVKDIRLMFQSFKKQNINFLEILFTKYFILNKDFEATYKKYVLDNAERIAHYDNYAAVKCLVGTMANKMKNLTHKFEGKVDIIERYGYDPKQLHHLIRNREFLDRYISGEKYSTCLIPKDTEYLIKIKSAKILFSADEATKLGEKLLSEAREIEEKYYLEHEQVVDTEIDEILNKCLIEIFKKGCKI